MTFFAKSAAGGSWITLFNFEGPLRELKRVDLPNGTNLIRGRSSAGRAPALQAGGRQFDSVRLHQRQVAAAKSRCSRNEREAEQKVWPDGTTNGHRYGLIAQVVRAHA